MFPNLEWSGVLFYNVEGNFNDGSLHIKALDFFPMDVGTSTYTEFMMSPDVISYMTENPELLQPTVYQGLIHSHDTMPTFFSGTDTDTLREYGVEMPHFVSLIVNNDGKYTAAITRKLNSGAVNVKKFNYNSFNNVIVKGVSSSTLDAEELEYFYLDIQVEHVEQSSLFARFKEIQAQKVVEKTKATYSAYKQSSYSRTFYPGDEYKKLSNKSYGSENETWMDEYMKTADKEVKVQDKPKETKKSAIVNPLDSAFDYGKYTVDQDNLMSIVKQLITGCVLIPNISNIDLNKWCSNMNNLFYKRFGSKKEFEPFATWYVDYLIEEISDVDLYEEVEKDDSTYMAVIAYYVREELENLKTSNAYLDTYVELLDTYIV